MVKVTKVKCLRCGYEWIPRISDPRQCPKCRSMRWDKADNKYQKRVSE